MESNIFLFLGALGLCFMGVKLLIQSVQFFSEFVLKKIVTSERNTRFNSFISGSGLSFILQSPFVIHSYALSFLASGHYGIRRAYYFSLTSLLFSFFGLVVFSLDIGSLSLFLIGVGAFPFLISKDIDLKNAGKLFLAVGLVFFSSQLLEQHLSEGLIFQGGLGALLGLFSAKQQTLLFFMIPLLSLFLSHCIKSVLTLLIVSNVLYSINFLSVEFLFLIILGVLLSPLFSFFIQFHKYDHRKIKILTLSQILLGGFSFLVLTLLLMNPLIELVFYLEELFYMSFFQYSLVTFFLVSFIGIFTLIFGLILGPFIMRALEIKVFPELRKDNQLLSDFNLSGGSSTVLSSFLVSSEILKVVALLQGALSTLYESTKSRDLKESEIERIKKYRKVLKKFEKEFESYCSRLSIDSTNKKQGLAFYKMRELFARINSMAEATFRTFDLLPKWMEEKSFVSENDLYQFFKSYLSHIENNYQILFEKLYSPFATEQSLELSGIQPFDGESAFENILKKSKENSDFFVKSFLSLRDVENEILSLKESLSK